MNENNLISEFRLPTALRFGTGSFANISKEIRKYKTNKLLIVSDLGLDAVGLVDKLYNNLSHLNINVVKYTDLNGEPMFEDLTRAIDYFNDNECDLVIGIGGGSVLDVTKTIAALADKDNINEYFDGKKLIESRNIPCILLPTTSGTGSEVTKNAIFEDAEKKVKQGIVSEYLLPDLALIDPALTLSCPKRVTASSGVDALVHAIESYVSPLATPLTKSIAERAIRLFPDNIIKAVHNGMDISARENMSWVSVLGGMSLANAGVGAVHALSYPLGGKYHIEHGIANALLLPYVLRKTGVTILKEISEIAVFLNIDESNKIKNDILEKVVQYLLDLNKTLGLPTNLKELGVEEDDLENLAEQTLKIDRLMKNTPYVLSERDVYGIYYNAYHGK